MPRIVKSYDSDYKIATKPSGTITLDTSAGNVDQDGNPTGTVIISGNLEVQGTTTTVESTIVAIEDNILVLAKGTGESLPASIDYRAGIAIERFGPSDDSNAFWVYDEVPSWTLGGQSGTGLWYAERDSTKLPILTPGVVSQGNLYVNVSNGVISVTNSGDYEQRIFNYVGGVLTENAQGETIIDDDGIPNARAVVDYIEYQFNNVFVSTIAEGDTSVETIDEKHTVSSIVSVSGAGSSTIVQLNGQHGFTTADTIDISGVQSGGDPIENLNGTGISILEVVTPTTLRLDVNTSGGAIGNYVTNSGLMTKSGFIESRVKVTAEGVVVATFFGNRIELEDLEIQGSSITTTTVNEDIVFLAQGTGNIRIDDVLHMSAIPQDTEVLAPAHGVKIYSTSSADSSGYQAETAGNTGLFFINSNENSDELISKNRSLVYSMIF